MANQGPIKRELQTGVREGIFPGAVLLVAHKGEVRLLQAVGRRLNDDEPNSMQSSTIFDLASLTKPLATTLALMRLFDDEIIDLDEPLELLLPGEIPPDKRALTTRQLLSHCAGLTDWRPFYLQLEQVAEHSKKEVLRKLILADTVIYAPGTASLYSDPGFMLLEWIIEARGGLPLPQYLDRHFYGPLGLQRTFLDNPSGRALFGGEQFAATEFCPWRKKVIIGCVHDENAYSVGGYSGHAGLFGTVEEVFSLADLLRAHYQAERSDYLRAGTVRTFLAGRSAAFPSTWALGWDTPSKEGSSSGKHFSAQSFGHLGFTGTSLWMDLQKEVTVVLLTNRIHPTRKNERIRQFRPRLHDLIMAEFGLACDRKRQY